MKRHKLPDLLKGLAALFMVQIHITETFIDLAGKESMFGKVTLFLGGPFAAVVFMIVMGYFIAKNKSSFNQNFLRGVKIFILGFLLNIGLNFHLLLKIKFDGWQYNPLEYLFGVDILYLAGISIIVLSSLKLLKKRQVIASLILLFIIIGLTGILNEKLTVLNHYYLLPFIAGNYSWSYFPVFPWLAYPLTGFIFAKYQEKIISFIKMHKLISAIFLALVALMVVLFFKSNLAITINLPAYYHHTIGYFLWALGLTLLWVLLLNFILKLIPNTVLGNFFCWIGKNITLFYVIQWLIIGNIATAIFQTQTMNQYWHWLTCIFAASVLGTFLIGKINLKSLWKYCKMKYTKNKLMLKLKKFCQQKPENFLYTDHLPGYKHYDRILSGFVQ